MRQVWAAGITYIPMARGFVCLVAVLDVYSRKILAWRLSNSLTADFCIDALEEAIDRYGTPEIFNGDRGSQFRAAAFESVSEAKAGIGRYLNFYNTRRPHRSLDHQTPDAVYFKSPPLATAA